MRFLGYSLHSLLRVCFTPLHALAVCRCSKRLSLPVFFFFFPAACTKVGTSIHIQQLPGPLPDLVCHPQWCPCHSLPSAALGSLPLVFIALGRIGKVMKPDPLRARWVTWAAQLFQRVLCPLRFSPSGACMGGSRQAMSRSSWRF